MSHLKYQISALAMFALLSTGIFAESPCVAQETSTAESANQAVEPGKTPADSENTASSEKSEKKVRVEVSEEQRAAAMKFAEQNHPELARLLAQLQKSRPHESARAIKELTQQIQMLERLREKSPARYAIQLETWKHESQIRVLMARWARSKDAELETQVRELLRARREAKLTQLRADKERLMEQQRKLDQQLAALEQPVEELVDKEWEQLSKKAAARKDGGKKENTVKETTMPSQEAKAADAPVLETPQQ